jgi:hypothetical protein
VLLFGEDEVLVAALHLARHGIGYRRTGGEVRYHHLECARHEIIYAEGAPVESYLGSDLTEDGSVMNEELNRLFPAWQETPRAVRHVSVCADTRPMPI